MAKVTFKTWRLNHLGKYVRYNKTTCGYQCVDEIKSILVECKHYDFYKKYPALKNYWSFGNARQWYENFYNYKELTQNFKRVANTKKFVPIEYDILVFTENNQFGHICSAYNNDSTTSKIYSIDQNYPTGSPVNYCKHKYVSEGFLGVLRPYRYIRADVNVRNAPSVKKGKVVGELKKGERIFVYELSSDKKWAKVSSNSDMWISYNYVDEI